MPRLIRHRSSNDAPLIKYIDGRNIEVTIRYLGITVVDERLNEVYSLWIRGTTLLVPTDGSKAHRVESVTRGQIDMDDGSHPRYPTLEEARVVAEMIMFAIDNYEEAWNEPV